MSDKDSYEGIDFQVRPIKNNLRSTVLVWWTVAAIATVSTALVFLQFRNVQNQREAALNAKKQNQALVQALNQTMGTLNSLQQELNRTKETLNSLQKQLNESNQTVVQLVGDLAACKAANTSASRSQKHANTGDSHKQPPHPTLALATTRMNSGLPHHIESVGAPISVMIGVGKEFLVMGGHRYKVANPLITWI